MICFPKTGLVGSRLGKRERRLRQGVTGIEDSGLVTECPNLVAMVTGDLAGARCEQSSPKLMSPKGQVWLRVNAFTLPMAWGVASGLLYFGRAAVLSWHGLYLSFSGVPSYYELVGRRTCFFLSKHGFLRLKSWRCM